MGLFKMCSLKYKLDGARGSLKGSLDTKHICKFDVKSDGYVSQDDGILT